jgi:hypothetical protein
MSLASTEVFSLSVGGNERDAKKIAISRHREARRHLSLLCPKRPSACDGIQRVTASPHECRVAMCLPSTHSTKASAGLSSRVFDRLEGEPFDGAAIRRGAGFVADTRAAGHSAVKLLFNISIKLMTFSADGAGPLYVVFLLCNRLHDVPMHGDALHFAE